MVKRYAYAYDKVGNRSGEQVDDAPRLWTFNNANEMTAQAGGGALRFEGTVGEPATVTVQGQPALVTGSNAFLGTASVGTGTPTVTVTATDGSGNTASQTYEVDVATASASFTYDANGNLTAHGTKTYEWDAENRLMRVLVSATEVARFKYDGYGRRAEKTSGGVTRAYVYDGDDIAEERAGSTTTRIVHGPGVDQPLAAVTGSTPTYYLADHLGSIAQHTDTSQQVTLTRTYDPFGNLTSGATTSGYAFTGREWDAETGLYYYRARYYDATLGRFISGDPSGFVDGPNVYAYVGNLPSRFRDPSGRQQEGQLVTAAAGAAVGVVAGGGSGAITTVVTTAASNPVTLIIGGLVVVGVGVWWYFSGDESSEKPAEPAQPEVCKADPPQSTHNPAQDKKLTPGEITRLQAKFGREIIHDLKGPHPSRADLYKRPDGEIVVKPKGGKGPGEPTGINIKDLGRR